MADRKLSIVASTAAQQQKVRDLIAVVDGGGGPPHDGGMDERVKKLESLAEKTVDRLTAIERDLAVMKSNYASKADVSDAKSSIILWVVGAIFVAQLLPMLKDFVKPTPAPVAATAPVVVRAPH